MVWEDFDKCEAVAVKAALCQKGSCINMVGADGYAPVVYKGADRFMICLHSTCGACKGEHILPFAFRISGDAVDAVWYGFPKHQGKINITTAYVNAVARFIKDEPKK